MSLFSSVSEPSELRPLHHKSQKVEHEINYKYAKELFCLHKKKEQKRGKVIVVGKKNLT